MQGCKNGTDINGYASEQPTGDHTVPLDKTINLNDAIEKDSNVDDELIVVRRQSQTVRAIEPRTGGERWNFSVGQHELELINQPDCHTKSTDINEMLLNLDLKVIVPEGIICVVQKSDPNVIVWKQKFDFPIVNVWKKNDKNQLQAIDLFESAQWLWQTVQADRMRTSDKTNNDSNADDGELPLVPSIYIGMHKKQLYIQESEQLRLMQIKYFNDLIESETKTFAQIPWQPYEASSSALALLENDDKSVATTTKHDPAMAETTDIIARNHLITATSVLYASEYVNGNGFYLYAKSTDTNSINIRNESSGRDSVCDKDTTNVSEIDDMFIDDDDFDETPVVNIVSLWYWWKEIMVISLTTALALNVLLSQRKIRDPVSVFNLKKLGWCIIVC